LFDFRLLQQYLPTTDICSVEKPLVTALDLFVRDRDPISQGPQSSRRSRDRSRLMPMAFQRKKPAAIGIKAHFPGFIEPALAKRSQPRPSH
jgi:hypothetical protein